MHQRPYDGEPNLMDDDRIRFCSLFRCLAVVTALLMPACITPAVAFEDGLSVEQASAALGIAMSSANALRPSFLAAELQNQNSAKTSDDLRKLQQVSTNAVARALQFGPPSRSEADANNPLIFRSVVVDINQTIPQTTVETFRQQLPSRLLRLSSQWRYLKIDPVLAYDALRICVNPPSRPDRLFLYAKESSNSRFPAFSEPSSAAHELIEWAVRADRIADLKQTLNDQQLDSVAEGCFLFLLLTIEADDEGAIRKRCQQLQTFVRRASDPSLLRLLATCLMKAEPSVRKLPEASNLLQLTGETLLAVDGQSVAQANFAATAAVDGFRITIDQTLATERNRRQASDLVEIANRLLLNHRLPKPLDTEFQAAIADQFLTSSTTAINLVDPIKSVVAERQVRYPKERWLVPEAKRNRSATPTANDQVSVNWNPGPSPDSDAIWVQQGSVDGISVDQKVTFTISGLISVGSPSTNADGSIVAFHGRTADRAMGSGNHLYVVDRKLKTMTDIGPGVNPSLTPTGKRLTCSRYTPDKGVWLVRSDGSNWRLLDETGWASKFSPDGNNIAYTLTSGGRTSLAVYDLVSHSLRPENVSHFFPPAVNEQVSAVTGWPFCWSQTVDPATGPNFWWLNRKNRQLLRYPVYHWMMDKYLPTARISGVDNVGQDLNSLADDQLIWLGPVSSSNPALGLWKTGSDQPLQIEGRRLLGVTIYSTDQVLLFSKPEPSGR